MRTEEEKSQRRENSRKQAEEYEAFFKENPELLQACSQCKVEKVLKEFVRTYEHRKTCKECHRIRTKERRKESGRRARDLARKHGRKSAVFILSLKEGRTCGNCTGCFPPEAMDFHHLSDKAWTISKLYGKSSARIMEEVGKCILLCANCHRDETQSASRREHVLKNRKRAENERKEVRDGDPVRKCARCKIDRHLEDFPKMSNGYFHSYCRPCKREYEREKKSSRKNRATSSMMHEIKEKHPCTDCGESFNYWQMDMDHVTGEKVANINKIQSGSKDALLEELKKCELTCAVCHRKRTCEWRRNADPCECGFRPRSLSDAKSHREECGMAEQVLEMTDDERQKLLDSITVRDGDLEESREFLEAYHYAGYGRSASAIYAICSNHNVVAIVKFSHTVRKEVATSMGWRPDQVLELDRFCIRPKWHVKNLASKAMGEALRRVKRAFPEVVTLVSFADPAQGHSGGIYAASNWTKVGMTASSYEYEMEGGVRTHKKTLYNAAMRAGMKEKEYAESVSAIRIDLPPKHKFAYELR